MTYGPLVTWINFDYKRTLQTHTGAHKADKNGCNEKVGLEWGQEVQTNDSESKNLYFVAHYTKT